jgi:hypothetical protein
MIQLETRTGLEWQTDKYYNVTLTNSPSSWNNNNTKRNSCISIYSFEN